MAAGYQLERGELAFDRVEPLRPSPPQPLPQAEHGAVDERLLDRVGADLTRGIVHHQHLRLGGLHPES
jgi:hypothetical protein